MTFQQVLKWTAVDALFVSIIFHFTVNLLENKPIYENESSIFLETERGFWIKNFQKTVLQKLGQLFLVWKLLTSTGLWSQFGVGNGGGEK